MELIKNLAYKRHVGFDVSKLITAIEDGYEVMRKETKVVKKTSFSPSSIAYNHGRCPRRWVMLFQGEWRSVDTASAASLAIMNSGTGAHKRIQDALKESGIVIEEELEVTYDDPPIRGFVDNIVMIDGEEVVVEIKTTRQEAFEPKILSMKPAYYHMYQLLTYMKILGKKHGAFIYENRNDNALLVIPVTMDFTNEEIIDEAFEWMRKVWGQYQKGKLPVRPWKQTSSYCQGCPVFDACWNEAPEGDVKIKPLAVKKW